MQSELLQTLARVYCDNEWAYAGKTRTPTLDSYGWVGLDYARLQYLIKESMVELYGGRYRGDRVGQMRLTGLGRDALYIGSMNLIPNLCCDSCQEWRASCEVLDGQDVCVDCRMNGLDTLTCCYIDDSAVRDACGEPLPVPVMP